MSLTPPSNASGVVAITSTPSPLTVFGQSRWCRRYSRVTPVANASVVDAPSTTAIPALGFVMTAPLATARPRRGPSYDIANKAVSTSRHRRLAHDRVWRHAVTGVALVSCNTDGT